MASTIDRILRRANAPGDDEHPSAGLPEESEQISAADPVPDQPTWRGRLVGILQILAIIALVGLAMVFSRGTDAPPGAAGPGDIGQAVNARSLPGVRVLLPEPTRAAVQINITGTVDARSSVTLTPEVTGRVVAVSRALRAGGSFRANERLLRLDRREFSLMLEQARAEVDAAESQLLLLNAESNAARANYALMHPGADVPPLVAKLPQIAQGQAQLKGAQARVQIAELNLDRTAFSLPFAGAITEASAEVGQMLSPGQSFGKAYSFGAVEVAAPIAQDDLARLQPIVGRTATVRVGDRTVLAKVERVSAELDARTRFSRLFLSFEQDHDFTPGTFVDVAISGPEVDNAFVLPESTDQGNATVWRVVEDQLQRQPLDLLGRSADGLVVRAFDPGDGIVVGPVPGASTGLVVRIVGQ